MAQGGTHVHVHLDRADLAKAPVVASRSTAEGGFPFRSALRSVHARIASMKTLTAVCILTLLAVPARVRAGHELPYYPSFYPHEIRLEAAAAAGLGDALRAGRIHASPGANPFGGALPGDTGTGGSQGRGRGVGLGRGGCAPTPPSARRGAGKDGSTYTGCWPTTAPARWSVGRPSRFTTVLRRVSLRPLRNG